MAHLSPALTTYRVTDRAKGASCDACPTRVCQGGWHWSAIVRLVTTKVSHAWAASFSTVPPPTRCDGSKQKANARRAARVAKGFLHVRIDCATVYPVAFALRSRSLLCIGRSAPKLFFFSMVSTSAGSAGSCALQRVLEASLALSVFGFCTSCAVASWSVGTVAGRTSQSEGPGGAGLPHVPAGAVATPCCYFVMPA